MKTRALLLALAMIVLIVWSWCAIQWDDHSAVDLLHADSASTEPEQAPSAVLLARHEAPPAVYDWRKPGQKASTANPPAAQLDSTLGTAEATRIRNDLAPGASKTMPKVIRLSDFGKTAPSSDPPVSRVRRLPPVADTSNAKDPDVRRLPSIEVVDIPTHKGTHHGVVRLPPVEEETQDELPSANDTGQTIESNLPSSLPELPTANGPDEEDTLPETPLRDSSYDTPGGSIPLWPPAAEPSTPADSQDLSETHDPAGPDVGLDPYENGFPNIPAESDQRAASGPTNDPVTNQISRQPPADSPREQTPPHQSVADNTVESPLLPKVGSAAEPSMTPPLDPVPLANPGNERPWYESVPGAAALGEAGTTEALPSYLANATPPATAATPEQVRQAISAVGRRVQGHLWRGFQLADRRAFYSARTEFIGALRLLAQSLDAQQGTSQRGQALNRGLWAIEEADDFFSGDDGLNAGPNVRQLITVHRTTVLKSQAEQTTPLRAIQAYYTYAQEQLADAVKPTAEGSQALSALGKLYVEIDKEPTRLVADPRTKGLVFQQAALLVDPNNAAAANELGVLLAREGRHAEARDWLRHSATRVPLRETWHNLAVVHTQLGEQHLAEAARQQSLAAAQRDAQGRLPTGGSTAGLQVKQVTPAEFSGVTAKPSVDSRSSQPNPRSARQTATPSGGLWNWLNKPWR